VLGREFCSTKERLDLCEFQVQRDLVLLHAEASMHSRFEALLEARDVPPPTQVFRVYLYAADNGPAPVEKPPAELARVLEDLQGFLPFKSFRQVSTGYLRTSDTGSVDLGGEPHHVVEIRFRGDPRSGKPLQIERFHLSRREWIPGEGNSRQLAALAVLETSFSMSVGETVVVGTSKLDGGSEALVVLLTAVR
jgi:hypothetical protein